MISGEKWGWGWNAEEEGNSPHPGHLLMSPTEALGLGTQQVPSEYLMNDRCFGRMATKPHAWQQAQSLTLRVLGDWRCFHSCSLGPSGCKWR